MAPGGDVDNEAPWIREYSGIECVVVCPPAVKEHTAGGLLACSQANQLNWFY